MPELNGSLFLIGGAAETTFADFVKLAGGPDAHIAVLGHASASSRVAVNDVTAVLSALGVKRITGLTARSTPILPTDIDAVFICGGDQGRMVRILDKNGLGEQVRDAARRGLLVAGTSAGAAAASHVMVNGGMDDKVLRRDSLVLVKGLCLIPGVVFDTHFAARERQNRGKSAVATVRGFCCLGMDEDTGVHITGRSCRVYGAGEVWLFQAPERTAEEDSQTFDTWEAVAEHASVKRFKAGDVFELP